MLAAALGAARLTSVAGFTGEGARPVLIAEADRLAVVVPAERIGDVLKPGRARRRTRRAPARCRVGVLTRGRPVDRVIAGGVASSPTRSSVRG